MSVSFRAAVLRQAAAVRPYATSRPLAIERVELPDPAAGEVLVEIKAASICRSDLSVVNGDRRWPLPIVPGHEASGLVRTTGPGVEGFAPGERVALIFLSFASAAPRPIAKDA
jgi:alcohol dehydrogenase